MAKKEKGKVQKSVYLSAKSDDYIQKHMKAQNITNYSVAVDDAIAYAFDPEYRGEREAELTKLSKQVLYSLNEHRKKTGRDMMISQEMLYQLMFEIFKRLPALPEDQEKTRSAQALAQLDKTVETIARKIDETRPMKDVK